MSLYGDGVLHISVLYEILHIITAIVPQHYRHWHSVMQVGTGIVWIRPVRVLAAGLLGRDPDIEYHGIFQYLWTEHGQGILIAEGSCKGHGSAVRAAPGAFYYDCFILEALWIPCMLLVQHGPGLFFQYACQFIAYLFLEKTHSGLYAGGKTCPVEPVEQQLCSGVGLYNVAVHKVVIVLIEQVTQCAPITAVLEGLFTGVKYPLLPHGLQLVVYAPHHMDIGKVVQLKVFADMEFLLQPPGLHMGHEVSHLGLAGGRQGLQKYYLEYVVFHDCSLYFNILH